MASELVDLANIILQSAKAIDERCRQLGQKFPSLDTPYNPESNTILHDASVSAASNRLVSAAGQLVATAQGPVQSMLDTAYGFLLSSALRTASTSGIADILANSSEGIHVTDLATQAGIPDSSKLARILRALVTRHIFRQVAPDVFAHNRISSLLITQRPRQQRYKGAPGVYSIVDWLTDEVFKGATYMTETILTSETAEALPTNSAFNRAFNVETDVFTWYELPENKSRFECFNMAMNATRSLSPPGTILQGFDWSSLSEGSHVVDVGGGVGAASLSIYEKYPTLKFTIQDRGPVLDQAKEYWKEHHPEVFSSRAVNFQEYDFFAVQSINDASVFVLRYILHDWSDDYASKILTGLRHAASPNARLLVVDFILPELQSDMESTLKFEGPTVRAYMADLMTGVFNGRERSQGDVYKLLGSAGWKVEHISSPTNSLERHVVASPQ